MQKEIRTERFDGITIKVVSKRKGYNLIITIEEGTSLWQNQESDFCSIKFKKIPFREKIAKKAIRFKLTNQQYYRKELLKEYRKSFEISRGGICQICLVPTFVLPEDLAEKSRIEREIRTATQKGKH